MDFGILTALVGFVLGVVALVIFVQNRKSLAFSAFILFDIAAIIVPCLLYFGLAPIIVSDPNLQFETWAIMALIIYCGFVSLNHFLLQHHPTSQINARRTPFFVFLTILIVITFFGPQIERNFQRGGLPVLPGLAYLISSIFFFGYVSLEALVYSTKLLKHTRSKRRFVALLLSLGLFFVIVAIPFAFIVETWFLPKSGNLLFIFLGAGAFLLALALQADRTIPFLIPSQILELGVFDKSGRELFFHRFQENITPTEMKPGIIIGLQGLLTNLVGDAKSPRSGEVEEIKLKDRYILFDYSKRYEFFVIIILTTPLPYIKAILQTFLREFEKNYKDLLMGLQSMPAPLDSEKFKDATNIIDRIFTLSKG